MKFYSTKVSHQNGIMQAIQSLSKRSTVTNLSGNNSEAGTLLKKIPEKGANCRKHTASITLESLECG